VTEVVGAARRDQQSTELPVGAGEKIGEFGTVLPVPVVPGNELPGVAEWEFLAETALADLIHGFE
jgi:hypothetical protein